MGCVLRRLSFHLSPPKLSVILIQTKLVSSKCGTISVKKSEKICPWFLESTSFAVAKKTLPGLTVESPSQQSHGFSIQYSSSAVTELYTNSEMTTVIHCLLCAQLNRKTNIIESVCMQQTLTCKVHVLPVMLYSLACPWLIKSCKVANPG